MLAAKGEAASGIPAEIVAAELTTALARTSHNHAPIDEQPQVERETLRRCHNSASQGEPRRWPG